MHECYTDEGATQLFCIYLLPANVIIERSEAPDLVHHLLQIRELLIELVERSRPVRYGLLPIVILERSEGSALAHYLLQIVSSLSNSSKRSGRVSYGLLPPVIHERSEGPALVHHVLQIREREIGRAGPSLRSRMTVESRCLLGIGDPGDSARTREIHPARPSRTKIRDYPASSSASAIVIGRLLRSIRFIARRR
jgi:hypothetical protein